MKALKTQLRDNIDNYVIDGKKIEDFTNLLFWSTASELNSKYFILEHSLNALDFSEIYKVNAAGFSNSLNEYDYTHENVSFIKLNVTTRCHTPHCCAVSQADNGVSPMPLSY